MSSVLKDEPSDEELEAWVKDFVKPLDLVLELPSLPFAAPLKDVIFDLKQHEPEYRTEREQWNEKDGAGAANGEIGKFNPACRR